MKNKLTDLNNHLFVQLERLNEEELSGDSLNSEIERSKAIVGVAKAVVENARLALDAAKYDTEYGYRVGALPEMLENKNRNGV